MSHPSAALAIESAGVRLTGRTVRPTSPAKATIVAIHGGTYDSEYYDANDDSLLSSAPGRGYAVVALDRPGYGGSRAPAESLSFSAQARVLGAAVDRIAADNPGPIVLVGHSIGGMLSILTAASTNADLAGVEVSGLGELWQPGLRAMWGSMVGDAAEIDLPADAHAGVMLGPDETQRPDSAVRDGELLRPMPMPELRDVVAWSDLLPSAAAAVTVPVSLTLAEFDKIWQNDVAAQDALARHFTASPSVQVHRFLGAGHSIELHANAAEYIRTQLDFTDRVCPV